MKPLILTCVLTLSVLSAMAQSPTNPASSTDADVSTLDGIMKAVYDVISGDAGVKRDWDRFRTLFHKDARLIPTGKNQQTGVYGGNALSPEDYIKRVEPVFAAQGFHERELARHIDQYGNIAQVFSTYHAFRKKDDKEPFLRGINSFQLMFDGKRWWVLTIYWQAETPDNPIPAQYLK
ncbi:MAG: nuclear transport factor 2 family protein [Pyrinomonadaceae bacterium]